MRLYKDFRNMCTPAMLYFTLSVLGLVLSVAQNMDDKNMYRLGTYATWVEDKGIIFVFHAIYILFWTWVLNLMCKDNHGGVAWFLVLLPIMLFFMIIALFMLKGSRIEECHNKVETN